MKIFVDILIIIGACLFLFPVFSKVTSVTLSQRISRMVRGGGVVLQLTGCLGHWIIMHDKPSFIAGILWIAFITLSVFGELIERRFANKLSGIHH